MARILIVFSAVLATILTAGSRVAARTEQPAPSLRVRIAQPEGGAVVVRDGHSHFHVVIENVSNQPQKVINEWNSWGYSNLRFEYTTPGGEKKVMQKLGRDWSKNFLTTTILQPGELMVREVYLDQSVWSGLPVPQSGEAAVTMRAIFAQEDPQVDAWHGKIESGEQQMTFRVVQ